MGRKIIDLTGQKFGRLTVVKRVEDYVSPSGQKLVQWLCECECGNKTIVQSCILRHGKTASCGCLRNEVVSKINTKHGQAHTRPYKTWKNMIARCYHKNYKNYKNYGGRGIQVCEEWKNDFVSFYNWAISNGYTDNLTLDRINTDGNYEPNNCRWVSMKEQDRNRRTNRLLTYNGETHCYAEWEQLLNFGRGMVWNRLNRGWSIEKALTTPVKQRIKHV